jgi:SAM-dependent methyltransferase
VQEHRPSLARRRSGPGLLGWLASFPPSERDARVEEHLGIRAAPPAEPPGADLVGYHAAGVASIVRMLIEVPVRADDVVLDLGSGLGKVVLLTHLLTGARARGVELQPALVSRARNAASAHGLDVTFEQGDAREADLDDANVFFLYLPFTGPALARVLDRLMEVATLRPIVVATLGVDLDRVAPWLARRPVDSFWLALYDGATSGRPGAPDRAVHRSPLLTDAADLVAFERP